MGLRTFAELNLTMFVEVDGAAPCDNSARAINRGGDAVV